MLAFWLGGSAETEVVEKIVAATAAARTLHFMDAKKQG
jgi:hypothetical protein